jgi:hypothetical protein
MQAFDVSDLILLITTPDIPALKNLKITLETLTLLNYPREQSLLVLNRSQPKVGITAEEVSTPSVSRSSPWSRRRRDSRVGEPWGADRADRSPPSVLSWLRFSGRGHPGTQPGAAS